MGKNYKIDYITNFIIRFDYNDIREGILEELQKIFEEKYKFIINETKMVETGKIKVDFEKKQSEIESEGMKKEFLIYNAERTERLKFSSDFFIYETIKYTSYDSIKNIIQDFIDIINKNGKEEVFNRIGMRYINNIELPYEKKEDIFDWKDYINEKIWNNSQFINYDRVLQKITVQEFKSINKDSNIIFRLQTGIPNPNKPAEIIKKNFLIDIDGFTMNVEKMINAFSKLQEIHDELSNIFDNCIESKLINIMNGENINEQVE